MLIIMGISGGLGNNKKGLLLKGHVAGVLLRGPVGPWTDRPVDPWSRGGSSSSSFIFGWLDELATMTIAV